MSENDNISQSDISKYNDHTEENTKHKSLKERSLKKRMNITNLNLSAIN